MEPSLYQVLEDYRRLKGSPPIHVYAFTSCFQNVQGVYFEIPEKSRERSIRNIPKTNTPKMHALPSLYIHTAKSHTQEQYVRLLKRRERN